MAKHSDARAFDFVMSHVACSQKYAKDPYIERWREQLANFIVDPEEYGGDYVQRPYSKAGGLHTTRGIVLKDAETHKAIMTWASNLVLAILGDPRGEYVKARPTGREDVVKSRTVTSLLRYDFALPGTFRTMVEAIVDMLLFGTSVVEINWRYQEREQLVRELSPYGDEMSRMRVVAWNDPVISVVDNQRFYPDPGQARIENMSGVAKGFDTNAMRARELANGGVYDKAAVERAINNSKYNSSGRKGKHVEYFREGLDQPENVEQLEDFTPLIGVEYWGEVPWVDDRGSSRRVITIINEEVVRDDPFPLADADLPFRSLTINPVQGRFYGVSPAEVIRWDQSLQDALKVLLAEAVIRSVHPPIAYDVDSEIDLNKLRRWSPDIPIGIRGGPNGIGTLRYDANVFNAFNQTGSLKQSMQEASGALAAVQGQGIGVNRASASEAQFTQQQALSRPELAAALLERDAMPGIARSLLSRNQQFLDDDVDLAMRVGEIPGSEWIGNIMGDFDIQFVGSRLAMSRQDKLQSIDRLAQLSAAIPQAGVQVAWPQIMSWITGDLLELDEVAALMGDESVILQNMLIQRAMQAQEQTGNGNGTIGKPLPDRNQAQLTGAALNA